MGRPDPTEVPPRVSGQTGGLQPSAAWRVLVVESDTEDAELLVRGLQRHSHHVERVDSGMAALRVLDDFDLLLLDLELPDLDGLEVCRRVRSAGSVPVIAVTSRGTELDRVLGLQAGADDYLVKPYGFRELLARMDAVMRRVQVQHPATRVISHGALSIDTAARQVSLDGRQIEVTRKEFDLLHLLASHPDAVVPRNRIMQQVWGDVWSRRTVDTHVSSLRHKLGSSEWIITVRGVGFQLGRA
ncbi:DNA-binding response regulator [Streptomyces tubercidicus]|uniref:DNA-binding response regulator n=1 Tax=Streptomyces tubercidicus TaxID=47759 RepID=A0A640V1X9_9ACTN|nr:DNA-binding response regulator [Streptomyces tubercidicus]